MHRIISSGLMLLVLALIAPTALAAAEPPPSSTASTAAVPAVPADGAAGTPSMAQALRDLADPATRDAALATLAAHGDATLLPALDAFYKGMLGMRDGEVVMYGGKTEVPGLGPAYPLLDALSGRPLTDAAGAALHEDALPKAAIKAKAGERGTLRGIMAALQLRHPDPDQRRAAIRTVADNADVNVLPALREQLARDPEGPFARLLAESIARIQLGASQGEEQLAAVRTLGALRASSALPALLDLRTRLGAADAPASAGRPALLAALERSIAGIEARQAQARAVSHVFAGISLGSILILLALGLSIIFGLMGVINMAHGELMMIGAYTTWLVSKGFAAYAPGWFEWYLVIAIPASFLVAAGVGWLIELLVIRHLYGRPLETLLATWGVSLVLIQAARVTFGDLLSTTPPTWLTGGWQVTDDIVLPANRLFIIGFATACIVLVYALINRTKLGLLLRATTQNRQMASCLGVPTRRIDGLTFALGAGLAGLAGVAVPMYDKINPGMGQGYIVESFMVVVTGGVGKLAGVIWSGLGLGAAAKFLEPWLQAVFTKVAILGLIILFLQWKPSGLFPAKGRTADA